MLPPSSHRINLSPTKQGPGMSNQPETNNDPSQGEVNGTNEKNGAMSSHPKTINDPSPLEAEQEIRKSQVRICVTYVATTFIFVGGGLLIIWFASKEKNEEAMAVFNTILPIAAGIVTYWFAARSNRKKKKDDNK